MSDLNPRVLFGDTAWDAAIEAGARASYCGNVPNLNSWWIDAPDGDPHKTAFRLNAERSLEAAFASLMDGDAPALQTETGDPLHKEVRLVSRWVPPYE